MTSSQTTIGPDSFVTISYVLFEEGKSEPIDVGGGEEGSGEDRFRTNLSYVHGYGLMVPAIEKGLVGREPGSKVVVHAEPADAFGFYEQDGLLEIEKEGLEGSDELVKGDEVLASGPDGDMIMRVLEVREDTIVVDTNHPLAGKKIRFEVDVVDVRPATDEEIEEAQDELEELADACGCGEDHDHDGHGHDGHGHDGHGHDGHDHDDHDANGGVVQASELVQLGLGKDKPARKSEA